MKNKKNIKQWLMLFVLGVALIIVYHTFDSLGWIVSAFGKMLSILTPFVVGFAIAFLLYAPISRLEKVLKRIQWRWMQKAARPIALVLVYLAALGLLAGVVGIVIPALVSALVDFVGNVPTYYNNVSAFIKQYMQPGGILENLDIQEKVNELYAFVQQYLTVDKIVSYAGEVVHVTSSIVDIVMALIVSVYMLLGRESLLSASKSVLSLVVKPKTMSTLSMYGHKISQIFYNYLYSQLLDAVVVGILATIGFLLARMPNAAVFGMLLGLMNMIPYFGALIGGILSVLVMLLSGNFYGAVFIAIYIIVMQQLDANIIQPRIVGENVGLKAIYVLLGITIFGGLFGFWGIFLGAPLIAVIRLLLTDYIRYRKTREIESPFIEE